MNFRFFCAVFIIGLLPTFLLAGRQDGLMTEFRRVEEAIRGKKKTSEQRLETLENNLLRAFRHLVFRHFYDKKQDYFKDLTREGLGYENPTSSTIYFVKFKELIAKFEYARDPEYFIQSPVYVKFMQIDPELLKEHEGNQQPQDQNNQNQNQNQNQNTP